MMERGGEKCNKSRIYSFDAFVLFVFGVERWPTRDRQGHRQNERCPKKLMPHDIENGAQEFVDKPTSDDATLVGDEPPGEIDIVF